MTKRRMRPHFHWMRSRTELYVRAGKGMLRRACDLRLRAPGYLFLSLFRSPISFVVKVLGRDLRD